MQHHLVVGGLAAILTMLVRSRLKWCVDLSTYGFEGSKARILRWDSKKISEKNQYSIYLRKKQEPQPGFNILPVDLQHATTTTTTSIDGSVV